jgi:tetratricopeptide (TPR) repeat protein
MNLKVKYIFCFLFFAGTGFIFSQDDKTIDSLKLALKNAKHDTTRCNILNELIENANEEEWPAYNEQLLKLAEKNVNIAHTKTLNDIYSEYFAAALNNSGLIAQQQGEYAKALGYYHKCLKIEKEIKNRKGIAISLNGIAIIYYDQGDIPKSLEFFYKSLKIQEEIKDTMGIAYSLNNIGSIYEHQGDISKALESYHKSLKIQEDIKDKRGIAASLNNIGLIHQNQGESGKALEFFNKSLKIMQEIEDKGGIAYALNNIGLVYNSGGNYSKALEFFLESLKLQEEIKDKSEIAACLNNIGRVYETLGYPSCHSTKEDRLKAGQAKALGLYQRALKIQEEIKNKNGIAFSLNNIGFILVKQGKFNEAIVYGTRSMRTAKELAYPMNIKRAASLLKTIYKNQNKFAEAFEMYELEIQMRDSINNQETRKASIKKQFQYDYEKKEAIANAEHKNELEKQQAVANEKDRKQKIVIWSVAVGLFLILIFAAYVFRSLRVTRKQKQFIEIKNKETEAQKQVIEEKQKEILDSIHYAKRIQVSLMPTDKYISKVLSRQQLG